jgi:hypothetical protein
LFKVGKDKLEQVWANDDSLRRTTTRQFDRATFCTASTAARKSRASLRCVEWKTGKVLEPGQLGCASLVLADGKLIGVTDEGDAVLIEATEEAYRVKGRASLLAGPCRSQIALADGGFTRGREEGGLLEPSQVAVFV